MIRRTVVLGGIAFAAALITAQSPVLRLAAVTDNVAGAGDSIRIDVLRWSTDAERDALLAAWNLTAAPGSGRGRVAAAEDDAFLDGGAGPAPAAGAGKAKGKGKGRGGDVGAPPQTPERSLAAALGRAPVVGHLWSSEVAGYSLRYAIRVAETGGGERIILITDRRLGAWNDLWKSNNGAAAAYEFSVIELRLSANGEGEGKSSLTAKVAADAATKTIMLENYGAGPVILKGVKKRS